jgi:hypothetical protein
MLINVTYDSSVTGASNATQIEGAIQAAVAFYEHAFRDVSVTLNIDFKYAPLAGGDISENEFNGNDYSYAAVAAAFENTAVSPDDRTAYATLPANDPTTGSGDDFFVTTGQARVLGLSTFKPKFDDTVTLGSNFSWSFDPNDRDVAGEYDAIGALEHEMSEGGMGRIGSLGREIATAEWTPDDLFSYASTGVRQLAPGAHYFSLDGTHLLEEYNNPQNGGDASDWLPSIEGDSYGDSYQGMEGQVTPTDLRVDDVLGWTRTPATIDDFSGDAVSDVLFYNASTGDVGYYAMNGSFNGWLDAGASSTAYRLVGVGDFNGDYTDDILFRNATTGDMGFYAMSNGGVGDGSGATQGNDIAGTMAGWVDIGASSTAYSVVGTGDFLGTGTDDVLFSDNATGDLGFYSISNGVYTGWHDLGGSSTAYNVVGIGDFYGNGTDDILFRDNATGDYGFYSISNGIATGWHDLGWSSTAYSVVGIGDFYGTGNTNANGTDDILFRDNATGDLGFMSMLIGINTGWHDLGASSTAYSVVGVGDYYGNGTDDILFRDNATGALGFYSISSGAVTGWHSLAASSTAYSVVNSITAPIA